MQERFSDFWRLCWQLEGWHRWRVGFVRGSNNGEFRTICEALAPTWTLFLFFALEAILGNKAEGKKARGLAIRRAILSHKTNEGFTHPGRIYLLYDDVRSVAVHGGDPPHVPEDEIKKFSWDLRWAINEFLDLARQEGLSKRGRLLAILDSDPNVTSIEERFLPPSN